jgi:hypothetical protein
MPVVLAATDFTEQDQREQAVILQPEIAAGAIHIEFPGHATITVEQGADCAVQRTVLKSLSK